MANHIDRTRTAHAKARAMTRRNERRVKSAQMFMIMAFGPVEGEQI